MWARYSDIDRMFRAMDALQARMNNIFTDSTWLGTTPSHWRLMDGGPKTNLTDAGEYLEMTVEVPGVAKEDLNLKIQGNYLEISATRKRTVPEGAKVHRGERTQGSFTRSFTLPAEVDSSRVEAHLDQGILRLRMPKAEAAKPRQITIN